MAGSASQGIIPRLLSINQNIMPSPSTPGSARLWPVLAVATLVLLAGCAGSPLRSYNKEMQNAVALVRSGDVNGALAQLEANNVSSFSSGDASRNPDGKDKTVLDSVTGKDILYYFEKGELLRLNSEYEQSRDAWLQADEIVRIWEDEYRVNPAKVIGEIGAYLVSDRVRRYDGHDYEKVFLSTKLMLDHVMLGNLEHARVEMKKTFEREKLIESFREQEYDKIQEEEKKRNVSPTIGGLVEGGYPMDELNSPEVRALKNGYQNAFAHYLSGYFFELRGENSLAAPGYRNALALRPDSKLIRDKVNKAGRAKPGPGEADVLFVVESGFAPAWKSILIPLPVPINKKRVVAPLSFPVIIADDSVFVPPSLDVGGNVLPVETLVNVDALARRQLKDQLPGILGRTVIRALVKSALQYQAKKKGGSGTAADVLTTLLTVTSERADERAWRTLPARLSIARAILPVGEQSIEFRTENGVYRGKIMIDSQLSIVPIRLADDFVYVGQRGAQGTMTPDPEEAEEEEVGEEEEGEDTVGVRAAPVRRSTARRSIVPPKGGIMPRGFIRPR
jgi:hypothetical protein